ncbi:MAG: nuclear transport factor 2 family protein [Novosphingobium sp.]|nr:nuclear transport factor 2 family protein [Novosphingobium sp.]
MPFTGPIEDRLAIRELYDANANGGSRGDREEWLSVFAEDARWKTHYFELNGRAEIAAKYDEIMGDVVDTKFFVQIGSIEVDGDTARVQLQQDESLLFPDGSTYDLLGAYDDVVVRRDGKWLIKDHVYIVKREKQPGQ